ncbi:uncharacterized protein LTR77_002919 [Saxophila tyrrhenica]|uniref:Flavin reductase like domain-containing protein n=1 Tax=Saxophila tyrrhenica TaxID=1690608 RepID=A0AAV9PFZ4_9PEZI|nr:hypothetical protein LTR77_002919 [Saxophila tyrrhenica]
MPLRPMYGEAPPVVSRRFYSNFFQWTLLLSPTKPCLARAGQRFYTASARRLADDRQERASEPLFRRTTGHTTRTIRPLRRERAGGQSGSPSMRSLRPSQTEHANNDPWENGETQSSIEKPFDTFEPWEEVVRYNSTAGVMLEVAVPPESIELLQREHGSMGVIRREFGATLELGQTFSKASADGNLIRVRSLLISGTHQETRAILRLLRGLQPSKRVPEHVPAATAQYSQSSDVKIARAPTRAISQYQEPTFLRERDREPKTQDNRPSTLLDEWEGTPDQGWLLQLLAPAKEWLDVCARIDFKGACGDLRAHSGLIVADDSEAGPDIRDRPTVMVTIEGTRNSVQFLLTLIREGRFFSKIETNASKNDATFRLGSPLIPHHEHGVQDMRKWECVLRERTADGHGTVQLAAPVQTWRAMLAHSTAIATKVQHLDIKLHVEPVTENGEMVSVLLTGALRSIRVVLSSIKSKRNDPDHPWHANASSKTTSLQGERQDDPQTSVQLQQTSTKREESTEEAAQLVEDTKTALRHLTHPVVLITSRAKRGERGRHIVEDYRGMTVSSFNCVALGREPIVSFNIKTPSRTWDAIEKSRRFCVHFLTATPPGAAIAHAFTQPYDSPETPFQRLTTRGAYMIKAQDSFKPPMILSAGVSFWLMADLVPRKCVSVGDHKIVVGSVSWVKRLDPKHRKADETTEGLAYAMRGYRGIGVEIEPAESISTVMEASDDADAALDHPEEGHESDGINDGSFDAIPQAREDDVFLANEASEEREASDVGNTFDEQALPQQRVRAGDADTSVDVTSPETTSADDTSTEEAEAEAEAEVLETRNAAEPKDNSEFETEAFFEEMSRAPDGVEETSESNSSGSTALPQRQAEEQGVKAQHPEPKAREPAIDSGKPGNADGAAAEQHRLPEHPHYNAEPSMSPVKGAWRGPSQAWGLGSRSSFSTSAAQRTRSYSSMAQNAEHRADLQSQVAHPSLLSTTVADFLGETSHPLHQKPRMRSMMREQREADKASRRLERALADGTLTPEESTRLETVVVKSERRIARKLAKSSAVDLRAMLDTGRIVDNFRAQWLESSIEKGLAVLLQEAKRLREALDNKWITAEAFEAVKKRLEEEHMLLNTEVMRLRQMVDEESEDGGGMSRDEGRG